MGGNEKVIPDSVTVNRKGKADDTKRFDFEDVCEVTIKENSSEKAVKQPAEQRQLQ